MKALVLNSIGDIGVQDIPEPEAKSGEVIVDVKACGICGSDIPRTYSTGAHKMPLVIGHEFSGEVDGRRVGAFPLIPCGRCKMCKMGYHELCSDYDYLGSRRDGGMAEKVSVPEVNLIDLPDEVDFLQAAMLEPMAVSVHSMQRAFGALGRVAASAAVVGVGTIGNLLAMFLKDAGVPEVDLIDSRLGDVKSGYYDIVFECVGRTEVFNEVLSMAAPLGVVMLVGNPYSDMTATRDTYWQILRRQLTVLGTWNSSFPTDWQYALKRVADGAVHPERLITHRFGLSDICLGFEMMRDKSEKYTKVMCVM